MQIPPRDFQLPFFKKEQVAKDTWEFYFDRSKVPDLEFLPGQHLRMTVFLKNPDGRGNSRSLSISSSPLDKKYLTITTKILQSAFKKELVNLAPGTVVNFFGPIGRFVLDEEEKMSRIFLAGGIGITPFHSMIAYAAEKNLSFPITLFVSFSTREDMMFYDELIKISKDHPNIKIIYTVTKHDDLEKSWGTELGRINADMVKKYCPDFLEPQVYICGSTGLVEGMLELVNELGVPLELVKKEKFVGY